MNKRTIILAAVILVLLVSIGVGVYLVRQQQTTKSSAQVASPSPQSQQPLLAEPSPSAGTQTCQPPDSVNNVRLEYPNCS